ncbi:hypothetical protein QJU74_10750 [Pasteurella atlantica]|nr:hypothetical protein [Pasteurella atlantica]MDP8161515.1 hypothetical protein [Pasteurella atlantica]
MTSDKVQKIIFEKVGSAVASKNIDFSSLAAASSEPTTRLLGTAIAEVDGSKVTVPTIITSWGGDIRTVLINALTESAASNVDIEQKVKDTQKILNSLIN